jgi:hypothetical protein
MKTQIRFSILISGRQYPRIVEREDTTSRKDITTVFGNLVFGRQHSTVRKQEDTTSGPLDSSVDCSETNVDVMPRILGYAAH